MIKEPITLVVVVAIVGICDSSKILVVFPIPGTSHSILGQALIRPLLEAGHEVTYITPIPMEKPPQNLRQIDVSTNFNIMPTEQIFNIEKIIKKKVDLQDVSVLFYIMSTLSNSTIMHPNVQNLIHNTEEHFDAVIVEWMYNEIYAGFSAVFNCPLIWSSSMEPHHLVLSLIDEDPNPAYTSDIFSSDALPFTFKQRISRLITYVETKFKKWMAEKLDNEIYVNAFSPPVVRRGRSLPPLDDIKYNGAVMFGNSHVSIGQSLRLPQNYISIAGYHIDEKVKPLPEKLKVIMDNAKNGVIYFCMGSLLKSEQIPDKIKDGLLKAFSELNQTVIWKLENTSKLKNVPKNVHVINWAPQQSILAHPNCRLFITHGGLLSQTESIHFGIPTIGMPMFADQFVNVNRAVNKGFAKRVDLDFETPIKLKAAMKEILGNPRYSKRAKELSYVYRNRPVPPRTLLTHWVQHVIDTRGATHLRSPALSLAWYSKMYLDLVTLVFTVAAALCVLIKWSLYSNLKIKKKNE